MNETVLVEIKIPALQQYFDFRISQKTTISTIIQNIVDCVMQIGGNRAWAAHRSEFCLCVRNGVLDNTKTFANYDIHTGDLLILV